jgi:hypothetical protein
MFSWIRSLPTGHTRSSIKNFSQVEQLRPLENSGLSVSTLASLLRIEANFEENCLGLTARCKTATSTKEYTFFREERVVWG